MFTYALRELTRKKRRTMATVSGYVFAVAIITIILNLLLNGEAAANSVLAGTGTHFAAYLPSCTEETCQGVLLDREHEGFYVGSSRVRPMTNSALDVFKGDTLIRDAAPFIIFRYRNEGFPVTDFTIAAVPPGESIAVKTNSCSAQDLVAGTFFSDDDVGIVVIEQQFALLRELTLDSALLVGGESFRVQGIVNTGIRLARADVYLPQQTALRIINGRLRTPLTDESGMFLFESKSSDLHAQALERVKRLLGAAAAVSSYNCWQPSSLVIGINTTSVFLITLIVFLCLLAFCLQAEYASVVERRHDMGILASIGWSKRQIIGQVVIESLLQALAGWFVGSLLAAGVLALLPAEVMIGTQALVGKQIFVVVFFFNLFLALGGGAIAGILPGFSSASQKPADCLRRL